MWHIPNETFLPYLFWPFYWCNFCFLRMHLLSALDETLIINLVVVLLLIASSLEMMGLPDLRLACPRHTQTTYRWVSFFSLLSFMWVSSFLFHSFSFDYFFMWFLLLFLMFFHNCYFVCFSSFLVFTLWIFHFPEHCNNEG